MDYQIRRYGFTVDVRNAQYTVRNSVWAGRNTNQNESFPLKCRKIDGINKGKPLDVRFEIDKETGLWKPLMMTQNETNKHLHVLTPEHDAAVEKLGSELAHEIISMDLWIKENGIILVEYDDA